MRRDARTRGARTHRRTDAPECGTPHCAPRATGRLGVRSLLLASALALAVPQGAALAQTGPARTATVSPAVKWGKWATAGLAVTFSALGIGAHNDADAAYRDLLRFCRASGPCLLGSDGRYAIRAAEDRYQRVVRGDRRARAWLIGGQAALIGSAALFVVELKRRRGPENIPFAPSLVAAGPGGVRVGWVIRWPVAAGR